MRMSWSFVNARTMGVPCAARQEGNNENVFTALPVRHTAKILAAMPVRHTAKIRVL